MALYMFHTLYIGSFSTSKKYDALKDWLYARMPEGTHANLMVHNIYNSKSWSNNLTVFRAIVHSTNHAKKHNYPYSLAAYPDKNIYQGYNIVVATYDPKHAIEFRLTHSEFEYLEIKDTTEVPDEFL